MMPPRTARCTGKGARKEKGRSQRAWGGATVGLQLGLEEGGCEDTSETQKVKVKVTQSRLFATPWTLQSMEFSRPEYWSR